MTVDHPQFGLMCQICFAGLTEDTCARDTDGVRWDVCSGDCARQAGIPGPSTTTWPEIMVTAHRRLTRTVMSWLDDELPRTLAKLRDEHGMQRATTGMAIGGDQIFGMTARRLGVPLRAAVPYPSQSLDGIDGRPGQRWTRQQQADWAHLRDYARATGGFELVHDREPRSPGERVGMLHRRNDWMLHRSAAVVALWEPGRRGGTHSCIEKAVGAGMPVILFDLTARTVTMPRPHDWANRLSSPALAVAKQLW
jgi:hypothetical protein